MKKRTETRIYGMRMLAMALLICISVGLLCGMVSATTGAESASVLKDHGIYTVAYAEDYSPYSYTDSDGNPAGMVIDIMNYIAQNAGFQISYVTVGEVNRYRISADINLAILTVDQLEGISVKSLPFTSLQMMAVADNVPLVTQGAKVGHLSYYYLDDGAVEAALPGCMAHTYFSYGEMVQDDLVGDLD